MAVQVLTDKTYEQFVASEKLVLVEFWARWCSYCKLMEPILAELSEEYRNRVTIATVDVETETETAERLNVQGLPTLLLYRNGRLLGQVNGFVPKETLTAELLDKALQL
ncbi:thioredoxin [Paenibacillus caseinilyticus]|uniref:Thioredoxin n=1 Tax=Paenibacillus mucilaginosus K02 TaxID=997761 RepID=I0BGM8_9BACL|nr:thioredoxin [Paenibacillus mucilaginosus]AFH61525.1 thioredoxin [Paenibacillus mucilaginosus K02]